MPKRPDKFPDGVLLSNPQEIVLHEGKITAPAIQNINEHLLATTAKINGELSLGDGSQGSRSGNIEGRWIKVVTPSTPSTEFPVYHGLGKLAVGALVALASDYCRIRTSSEGSWGTNVLFLQCDTASITLRLWIF